VILVCPLALPYFYGHDSPTENVKLYKKLYARLGYAVNARLASSEELHASGAIVIAPQEVSGDLLQDIKETFRISVILVIGNERLHSSITKTVDNTTVLKAPLSGGYVHLDAPFRAALTQQQFRAYFYGPKNEYTPFALQLPFDEVHLRRLGETALAPSSALPLGATRKVSETRTTRVEPSKASLLYSILACSFAQGDEEDQLTDANVAGFVYVTAVDEQKKQMIVLSPCPGKLPSPYLIMGSIKWIES